MPAAIQDNVPCSEMRGSNLHQGPRTAGNKSLLTYRSDIGIPGYSGYTPGWATVPIPISGSNLHTGRVVAEVTQQQAALTASQQRQLGSEYKHQYPGHAGDFRPPAQAGGNWYKERARQAAVSTTRFLGRTLYQTELLEAQRTAEQQLASSSGVPTTLVGYAVARAAASSGDKAPGPLALSSTTALTSTGQLLGYTTTYGSACAAAAAAGAAAAGAAHGSSASAASGGAAEARRYERLPDAVPPRLSEATTYKRDFGALGEDPLRHATALPAQQKLSATTRSINLGTSRGCQHLPGYTGFVPASEAAGEALGGDARPSLKAAMLPVDLDQYGRSRLAHYSGYKPRRGGLSVVQPAQGATDQTTQGFVDMQVARQGPQPRETAHCANSRTGLMTFFTGGSESVSENGLCNAQKFYAQGLRPLGGRFKTGHASKTTAAGAHFGKGSSLVPP